MNVAVSSDLIVYRTMKALATHLLKADEPSAAEITSDIAANFLESMPEEERAAVLLSEDREMS